MLEAHKEGERIDGILKEVGVGDSQVPDLNGHLPWKCVVSAFGLARHLLAT